MGLRLQGFFLSAVIALSVLSAPPVLRNPRLIGVEGNPLVVVSGNFAGDGVEDILLVDSGASIQVLVNVPGVPGGPFAPAVKTSITDHVSAAAAGHFDADGLLDVALLVHLNQVVLYHGYGDGTFTRGQSAATVSEAASIVAGDFNSDGFTDVAVGRLYGDGGVVHLGNGAGGLGGGIAGPSGSAKWMLTADLNGDQHLDLIRITDDQVTMAMGVGNGQFTYGPWASSADGGVAVGDFNGDTKPDLFVGVDRYGLFQLHLGNGDGRFTLAGQHRLVGNSDTDLVKAADVDGDGHLDLVTGSRVGTISVLRGNGDGSFDDPEFWSTEAMGPLFAADFDRNGSMDVVFRSGYEGGRLRFVAGTTAGAFAAYRSWLPAPNGEHRDAGATGAGDMNGDGKPDLLVIMGDDSSSRELVVMLNAGGGTWSEPIVTEIQLSRAEIAVGDVNGDGKPDVVLSEVYWLHSTASTFLGNGDGTFQTPLTFSIGSARRMFLGELNGDGRLDYVSSSDETSTVYLGSGTGTFSSTSTVPMQTHAVADLNGDGRAELAGNQYQGGIRIGINNGGGGFTVNPVDSPFYPTFGSLADFNGDQQLDIVTGGSNGMQTVFGRGDGTFGDAVEFGMSRYFDSYSRAADVNGDGATDVLSGDSVFLGDGHGHFLAHASSMGGWATRNAVADFDGDGAPEVFINNQVAGTVTLVDPSTGPDPQSTCSLTLAGNPAAPHYAQIVEYTTTVADPAIPPTGSILYSEDGVPVELVISNFEMEPAIRTTSFSTGAHTVSATYSGDADHLPVTQSLQMTVPRSPTSVSVNVQQKTCAAEIHIAASLFSPGIGLPGPSGPLTFLEGSTLLPSRPGPSGYGYWVSGLSAGTHTLTAEYAGDVNHEPSSAVFQQVVTPSISASISAGSGVFANESGNFASLTGSGIFGTTVTWSITNGTIDSGQGTWFIRYTAGSSGAVTLAVTAVRSGSACDSTSNATVPILVRRPGASMLYVIGPCRVFDSREGLPMPASGTRELAVGGLCSIPADARSVVLNATVVTPAGPGWMALFPSDLPWPGTSVINYRTSRTRASSAVVPLSGDGHLTVLNSGSSVHFIIDVTGYFK